MPAKKLRKTQRRGQPKEVAIRVVPTVSDTTPFYYCNHASVTHTQYEFVLTLTRIPTTLTPEQTERFKRDKALALEASLQIAISPRLMPWVIQALTEQKKKYEARFGSIEAGGSDDYQA